MDKSRAPQSHCPPNPQSTVARRKRARIAASALTLVALLAFVPTASAQGCSEPGRNAQCTAFGNIAMDSQRDIRGSPIDVGVAIFLHTGYEDQGARWLLFSVRNVEQDGSNPVTVKLTKFASPHGDIVTTRVEDAKANELNLWVDILDTPVGVPIDLGVRVGATERGAFTLEALVMAFDRGYAPIQDSSGNDASLFSFTLLGVNKETANVNSDGGSLLDGNKVPALGFVPLLAILAGLVVVARRRRA